MLAENAPNLTPADRSEVLHESDLQTRAACQYTRAMAFDEILASETKFCKAIIDNCLLPGAGLGPHHKNTAAFTGDLRRLLCDYGQGLPQTIQERHIAECVHNALVMAADDVLYDRGEQ